MPPDEIAAIARKLRDSLPALSPHAADILRACEDSDIDANALAAMLAENPTIAARLLGLANSSFYSRGKPVYALPKAIQTLGLVTVRGIAIGLVVGGQFSATRCPAFDAVRFWEHAVLTAQLAQQLAASVPPEHGLPRDAAYMTGLLHNIGLLALASLRPDETQAALSARKAGAQEPLGEQLRERLGFDHRQASAWLADAWRLPAPMREALAHQGERNYRGEGWALTLLTCLCARCAQEITDDNGDPHWIENNRTDILATLGLDERGIEDAAAKAKNAFDALRATAATLSGHENR